MASTPNAIGQVESARSQVAFGGLDQIHLRRAALAEPAGWLLTVLGVRSTVIGIDDDRLAA